MVPRLSSTGGGLRWEHAPAGELGVAAAAGLDAGLRIGRDRVL